MNMVSRLRKYKGLTQKDVADIFEISLQAYSRKERGLTPFTDTEKITLKKLINDDFPDMTIDDIFFNKEVSKVELK